MAPLSRRCGIPSVRAPRGLSSSLHLLFCAHAGRTFGTIAIRTEEEHFVVHRRTAQLEDRKQFERTIAEESLKLARALGVKVKPG